MKIARLFTILLVALIFSAVVSSALPSGHAQGSCPAGAACLEIVPASATVPPGGTLKLNVSFVNFPTFAGWDISVKTNNAVLSPTSITLVETFGGTASTFSNCVNGAGSGCGANDGAGVAHSAAASLGASDAGNGVLFTIAYNAIANGVTSVTFVASSVSAPDGSAVVDCTTTANQCLTGSVTVGISSTFDFSLSTPNPNSLTVVQGQTSSESSMTATLISGSPSLVTFSAKSLPTGVTPSFTNNPCSATCTVTVSFLASSSATTGTVDVTVTATGGGATHSTTLTLTVQAPFVFSLSTPSPNTQTLAQGSTSGSSSINATITSGPPSLVTFSVASALPSGVTADFTNNPCSATCTATVSFTASPTATTGAVSVTIGASGGGTSHGTTISLNIISSLGFGVTASQSSITRLPPMANATSQIMIVAPNTYAGKVHLSVSITPNSGLTTILSSTDITLGGSTNSANSTLTVRGNVETFNVTVTAIGNGFPKRGANVIVQIVGFSISVSPGNVGPIDSGVSAGSTVTVSALNGFTGNVDLSALPSAGVSAALNISGVVLSSTVTVKTAKLVLNGTLGGTYSVIVEGSSPDFPPQNATVSVTVLPPSITVSTPSVSATSVSVGQRVVVTVTLTDNSVAPLTVTVLLKWGDVTVLRQNATLSPGQPTTVSLIWNTTGYSVASNSLSVVVPESGSSAPGPSLAISEVSPPPFSLGNPYFLAVVALIVVIVLTSIIIFFRQTRKAHGSRPTSRPS